MNAPIDFGRCLTFINCQLRPTSTSLFPENNPARWRAVTISRQAGTGGHLVANGLAQQMAALAPEDAASWAVFDRNLLERVLEDHHLPARLARYMPEDRISSIQDTLDELFGLHPPAWTLVEKTSDTILRLAGLGNVILLGRGGNIITSLLNHVFHVRLVGSLTARTEFVQADRKLDKKTAHALILQEDAGRRGYLKKYFHKDIDDPQYYHLVINTPTVGHATAARLIADTLLSTSDSPRVLPLRHP
jgi:hypothetical protein